MTALAPEAQDFELMYEQTKAIREGKPIDKPIYNHVSGLLDPAETIKPPKVGRSGKLLSRQPQWALVTLCYAPKAPAALHKLPGEVCETTLHQSG